MNLRTVGLFLAILGTAPFVFGASIDLERSRIPITELAGPWRFHTGDDSAWSLPAFDDSGWAVISADRGWRDQGYNDYQGTAWYRLELQLPTRHGPLSLYIPNVDVSCQIYANGVDRSKGKPAAAPTLGHANSNDFPHSRGRR